MFGTTQSIRCTFFILFVAGFALVTTDVSAGGKDHPVPTPLDQSSVTVRTNPGQPLEAPAGSTVLGFWTFDSGGCDSEGWISVDNTAPGGYGDFAGLYSGLTMDDPSKANPTCFWGFFNGSTTNYACGGWPSTATVPYENFQSQYINNSIWSPVMPLVGSGSTVFLQFDVYHDLQYDALVFYTCAARFKVAGIWSSWQTNGVAYYGGGQVWVGREIEIGHLSPAPLGSVSEIQVALTVEDRCGTECGVSGTGTCHSNAPLFDNVRVYRKEQGSVAGSVWREYDAGPCSFDPTDFTVAGLLVEVASNSSSDVFYGITDASGSYIVPVPAGSYTVTQAAGGPWTLHDCQGLVTSYTVNVPSDGTVSGNDFALDAVVEQCDVSSGIVSNGINTGPPPCDTRVYSAPCPGVQHEYLFWLRYNSASTGPQTTVGHTINITLDDEFTIDSAASTGFPMSVVFGGNLCTATLTDNMAPGESGVVRVRATPAGGGPYQTQMVYAGGGQCSGNKTASLTETSQCSCDPNDKAVTPAGCGPNGNIIGDEPLIYKIHFENVGPGTAHNISIEDQLDDDIDPGSVFLVTASDTVTGIRIEPGNLLVMSLDGIELPGTYNTDANKGYVVFSVDPKPGLAEGTVIENSAAITFDFNEPVITNTTVNTIRAEPSPDASFVSSDSCTGNYHYFYFNYDGSTPDGATYLWDFGAGATPDSSTAQNPGYVNFDSPGEKAVTLTVTRYGCVSSVVDTVVAGACGPTGARPEPLVFGLQQNYPNPFNPKTQISYVIAHSGSVTLRIYDLAGRLVRTLVDGNVAAGSYAEEWDGRDHNGDRVASGIYFYRLRSDGRSITRKAVLLK